MSSVCDAGYKNTIKIQGRTMVEEVEE